MPIGSPSLAPVLLTTGLSIPTSPIPARVHSVPWSLAIAGEMSPVLYTYVVKGKEWRHMLDSSHGVALSVEGPVPVEVRNTGLLAHRCINLARNSPRRLTEAPLHGHSWISHWPLVTKSLSSPPPIPESKGWAERSSFYHMSCCWFLWPPPFSHTHLVSINLGATGSDSVWRQVGMSFTLILKNVQGLVTSAPGTRT